MCVCDHELGIWQPTICWWQVGILEYIYILQHNYFTNSTWNNMALHGGQNSWTIWVVKPIKTKSYSHENSNCLINWQGWKLLCRWPGGCEVSWNITQGHILGIATENPRHGQLIGGSILENNHPHQNPLKSCQIL